MSKSLAVSRDSPLAPPMHQAHTSISAMARAVEIQKRHREERLIMDHGLGVIK
jgi:hypothetical protein